MKLLRITFLLLIFIALNFHAQEKYSLKMPDVETLKKEFLESKYQMNVVLTFFERNYKATSEKFDIQLDPDFDNAECGFTKNFSHQHNRACIGLRDDGLRDEYSHAGSGTIFITTNGPGTNVPDQLHRNG